MLAMIVADAKIMAVKVGTFIDQPDCLVGLPALFCALSLFLHVEEEYLPTYMPQARNTEGEGSVQLTS